MKIFYSISFILLLALPGFSQTRPDPSADPGGRIVKFYPNPAASSINFDFQKNYDKGYSIQVYNFLGRQVSEIKNVSPKTTLNVSEFNRGIYIYQLKDISGKIIESGKFQVAR